VSKFFEGQVVEVSRDFVNRKHTVGFIKRVVQADGALDGVFEVKFFGKDFNVEEDTLCGKELVPSLCEGTTAWKHKDGLIWLVG
jgi:hypothetical protein